MQPVQASANITFPPMEVVPPRPPDTYIGMATLLANGIDPLFEGPPGCEVTLTFVCAQVAECALKAILSANGNDSRLKKQQSLRHNLAALWQLAAKEGASLELPPPQWLAVLSHLHDAPYFIRYSTGVHGMVLPVQSEMVQGVKRLLVGAIESRVRSVQQDEASR